MHTVTPCVCNFNISTLKTIKKSIFVLDKFKLITFGINIYVRYIPIIQDFFTTLIYGIQKWEHPCFHCNTELTLISSFHCSACQFHHQNELSIFSILCLCSRAFFYLISAFFFLDAIPFVPLYKMRLFK
jgi:hypothetical protein